MYKKWNLFIILTMLLGLVFTSPAQIVDAAVATDTADFVFTSSANPSDYGLPVTFTLSATGTDEDFLPFGSVDFYADGVSICSDVPLNNPNNTKNTPGTPATCTISTLRPGSHVITADFTSDYLAMYASEILDLDGGQTVGDLPTVTITPETLRDEANGTYVVQQLYPDWDGFLTYEITDGTLPPGISLTTFYSMNNNSYVGELSGYLAATDTFSFTFTVGAYDVNHELRGSRQYTWNVLTPFMTISPEVLPNAAYQSQYSQQLSVNGGYSPYIFSLLNGNLPSGITLSSNGLLSGFPDNTLPGQYPLTVRVQDANDNTADHNYTLVLDKGEPEVTVNAATNIYWNYPFNISAEVIKHTSPTSAWALDGMVAFYIDDNLVLGCEAVPMVNSYYSCSVIDNNLTVGTHTVRAEYTPTGWYANYYTSGSASNSLTVKSMIFVVQGYLYGDINQNAIKDSDESKIQENGWTINLDENCDGGVDDTTTTLFGGFSFSEIPSGGQCYRLTVIAEPGYQQTSVLEDFVLTDNIFVPIGFYYPTITLSPSGYSLPSGSVGVNYNQAFSASGGSGPYTFTVIEDSFSYLPEGLTLSADGVLSGTPTTTGYYNFAVQAEDANHATGLRNYSLEIEAIKTDGNFTFISSSNPSTLGEEVTFTVSASGNEGTSMPPFGIVTFYADETIIDGCSDLYLNLLLDENGIPQNFGNYPVICKTAALEEGTHEITATYIDFSGLYNVPTLTLTQQVETLEPLIVLPETLPDAVYGMPFSQWITGVCAEGYSCGFINWRLISGSLPSGIQFQPHGLLSGSPSETGSFTFTIEGYDVNNYDLPLGTRTYTLNVLKVTPKVSFDQLVTYYDYNTYTYKTYFHIYITHPNGSWSVNPAGIVSVSVDGSPVDVCTNLGPIPNMAYLYSCVTTDELIGLMPGIHTLQVDFTPDANAFPNFNSASGETTFTNPPRMEGLQFNDLDRDGVRDDGEQSGYFGYINLDRDCDGTNNDGTPADNSGQFSLNITPGEYCVNVTAYGDWFQTTILEPFTVDEETYKYFEIGFFESQLTYDPMELPGATVGKLYSHAVLINGGVAPYSLISVYQDLPGGFKFDISMNEALITFSGAPTTAGEGYISLEVQDSTGMKGKWESSIVIKADGLFTLTSSSNPAIQGEEVTFTLSATGDVVYYDSPYLPMGTVTFYADGTPIVGCTELFLNVDLDWNMGEFPAICKTTGLEIGSRAITATYIDWTGFYNDTTRVLTQVVNAAVSADLSINKSDSKDPVKPGSKLLYTLTVNNLGSDLAESVIVTDKLDVNTTYLSVSAPRGWKCSYIKNSGTVTCTTDSLASGSTAIIKITVLVNKTAKVGKELVNNAFVSSATFDPDLSNNAVVQKTLVVK